MRKLRLPRALQTMKFLGAWLVPWRPAFLTQAEPSKLQFFVSCRDGIGRQVAKYGLFEPELTSWIGARLQQSPKGIVIDVGANLGWHSVHAAKYDAVENIVAFEPDAFNAWLLERNLAINSIDKVIVEACAVGRERGLARLYRYKASNNGRHSLLRDYGLGSRVVPMVDIDSAIDALGLADYRVLLITPALSRSGNLPIDEMIDGLIASGFVPHLLTVSGGIAQIDRCDLQRVEHQVDVIWTR